MEQGEFAIVELMGHNVFGAKVTEVERFGIKMLHAEVCSEKPFVQFVHPQSIYRVTPCTEEQAKAASRYSYSPARQYEERQLPAPDDNPFDDEPDDEEYEGDGDGEGDNDRDIPL